MRMRKLMIIPDRNHLQECIQLAETYGLGFEYNDFFNPDVLDDEAALLDIILQYNRSDMPQYCTVHGAFYDVTPFSVDKEIQQISHRRIEQSIRVAQRIGAEAVVFHTNYNPFLNESQYIENWVEANADYWSRVLEENPNVNIYLENMFDTTSEVLQKLSERLCKYDNYGVCLDWAHASISKEDPRIWAERLGKYVRHVHINDNDLVRDLHLAWGAGKINRDAFYECYEKHMPNATILIETSSMENKIHSLEMLERECQI